MTTMTIDTTNTNAADGSPLAGLRHVAAEVGIEVKEDVDFSDLGVMAAVVAYGQNIGLSGVLADDNLRAEVLATAIAAAAFMAPVKPDGEGYAIVAPGGFIAIGLTRQQGQPDALGLAAASIAFACGLDTGGAAFEWEVLEFSEDHQDGLAATASS